jgi:hypothetical protein
MLDDKKFKDRFILFFAAAIVAICMAYVFLTVWVKPTTDNSTVMIGIAITVIGVYYGTSKSSQDKSETMKGMTKDVPGGITPSHQATLDALKSLTKTLSGGA